MISCNTDNGVEYITKLEHFRDLVSDNVYNSFVEFIRKTNYDSDEIIDEMKLEISGLEGDIDGLNTTIDDLESENFNLREELDGFRSFYNYMKELYGTGLEVANWHLNGDLESFDNFFESAQENM